MACANVGCLAVVANETLETSTKRVAVVDGQMYIIDLEANTAKKAYTVKESEVTTEADSETIAERTTDEARPYGSRPIAGGQRITPRHVLFGFLPGGVARGHIEVICVVGAGSGLLRPGQHLDEFSEVIQVDHFIRTGQVGRLAPAKGRLTEASFKRREVRQVHVAIDVEIPVAVGNARITDLVAPLTGTARIGAGLAVKHRIAHLGTVTEDADIAQDVVGSVETHVFDLVAQV